MNTKLYLLTGAAGFLGSHICSQLLERGEAVRAFVLKGDPSIKHIPSEVEIFEGDLCNEDDCEKFFTVNNRQTICIHCASMVTVNPDFSQKLIDVNVGGTENMLNACSKHPECTKFVYVGSTGAIPELPKGQKIKEVDQYVPYDDEKVVGWYSRSKAMASQKVLDAAKHGLNACIVCPTGILGPVDFALGETSRTVLRLIKGEMKVGIDGSFNLCDVRDLAHGCIMAADKGRMGESYILGNEEVTLKHLCELLKDELNCETCQKFLPIEQAQMIAKKMEAEAAANGTKPVLTSFSIYNLARNNEFDYSKATNELGYKTRSYKDTIHDQCVWFKEQGLI